MLVILIATQFLWLRDARIAEQRSNALKVASALEAVEKQLAMMTSCYEGYNITYLKPGDYLYLWKQRKDTMNHVLSQDTMSIFFDPAGILPDTQIINYYSIGSRRYNRKVEVHMRVTLLDDTSQISTGEMAFLERKANKRFRDHVSNPLPIDSIYDMNAVDSIIGQELRKEHIDGDFGFAFTNADNGHVVYSSRINNKNDITRAQHVLTLFSTDKFMRPHKLAIILLPYASGTHFWLLLSIGIILICTFGFYAFVRLYIRQTKLAQMKTDFINNLTHEFNTPMANISLAIETLETEDTNPRLTRILNIISVESGRLRENIDKALQIAALERDDLQMKKENVDIVGLIYTALSSYELQCEQLGGTIVFDHPGTVMLPMDETHLLNCICNLLDNAIKYRKNKPEIKITVEDKANMAIVTISDNGIGMSQDTQKFIFDKFYRASSGNLHNTKGFGLGLNYVREIVEMHKGKIMVWSKPNFGARFSIYLPK